MVWNRKLKWFSPHGEREWRKRRQQVKEQKNWRPVFVALARYLVEQFDKHFDLQGVDTRGNTTVWAPRKHDYYYNGQKLPRRPVLIRSGAMRKSIYGAASSEGMDFGFKVDYWQYHERGKGRMRRKTFVMTPEYQQIVANTIAWYRITGEVKVIVNGRD